MLKAAFLWLSEQPSIFRFVRKNWVARKLASRFVAGETIDEAIAALRDLICHHEEQYYVHDSPEISDAEFDAIFGRVKERGTPFGSAPGRFEDGKLNDWNGGRGVYFKSPDGHVLELMTVAQ